MPIGAPFYVPTMSGFGGSALALPRASLAVDFNSYLPVNVGYTLTTGRIDNLLDQSGLSHNAPQATAVNRPVIAATGAPDGVHPAFDFAVNGVDGTGVGPIASLVAASPMTFYAVTQIPAASRYVFGSGSPGESPAMGVTGSNLYIIAGTPALQDTATPATGTWGVVAGVFNGASSKIQITGGTTFTGDAGTGFVGDIYVGNLFTFGSGFCLNAKMTRFVAYSVAHDDATRAAVVAYLRAWSGL